MATETKFVLENNTVTLIRVPVTTAVKERLNLTEDYIELIPRSRVNGNLEHGGRKIMPEWCLDELRETYAQIHIWITRNRLIVS